MEMMICIFNKLAPKDYFEMYQRTKYKINTKALRIRHKGKFLYIWAKIS